MACESSDLRCVVCGTSNLATVNVSAADEGIYPHAVICQKCDTGYDVVDGVPFLGGYDGEDFLGLIEIVSTSGVTSSPLSVEFVRIMDDLLEKFHRATNKAAFIAENQSSIVQAPWWPSRYHEWLQTKCVTEGMNFQGKKVLNVGAGLGTDSVYLLDAGANVTCIDYSPMLVASGRKSLPSARWIGGFSHALPFKDQTFDIVCANAALHHMRSVPRALREMLRVLKPGGFLYTTGDPFRPDNSNDDYEFAIFDTHEGVLSGINERIIPFASIYDTFREFKLDIEIDLVVDTPVHALLKGTEAVVGGIFNDVKVPCSDHNIGVLRSAGGSIACKVRKNQPIAVQAEVLPVSLLSASTIASLAQDGPTSLAQIVPFAPRDLVDRIFPGEKQNWIELQNGWTAPVEPYDKRRGYKRARWILSVPSDRGVLRFKLRAVVSPDRAFHVLVNGILMHTFIVDLEWRQNCIDMNQFSGDAAALIELRWADYTEITSFDEGLFEVADREMVESLSLSAQSSCETYQVSYDLCEDSMLQSRLRSMLAKIRPMKTVGVAKKRFGRDWDGGYVLLETAQKIKTVYSLGISDDVSWDRVMAELGAEIYMYDHTVEGLPDHHPNFHFHQVGIAAEDNLNPKLRRLDTLMRENGHASEHRMILKMDIEMHEWFCLDSIDSRYLARFDQIVAEFHHTSRFLDDDWLSRAERVFTKLYQTHQVIHVHGNNNTSLNVLAGIALPDVFELTFANRAAYEFETTDELFPTSLDAPCTPTAPDLVLGAFAF